jgi:hypothetical protein
VRLIWTPEGGERREWEFTPRLLRTSEAEPLEAVGATIWEDLETFEALFRKGNRRALRAALWVMRRRDEPRLEFADLDLRADEVHFDPWGDDERTFIRERLLSGQEPSPAVREVWVEVLGEDPTAGDPKAEPSDSPPPPTG